MAIATDAMVDACWPVDVPRNYIELKEMYGAYVSNMLRKYNKIGRNFEEQHSHIWRRLVELDVIGQFMSSVAEKMPNSMTALEACDFLGITFKQWAQAMAAYHAGTPVTRKGRVVCRRIGHWMPTPMNMDSFLAESDGQDSGYTAKDARFYTSDVTLLSSKYEYLAKDGTVKGLFQKCRPVVHPQLKPTGGHFKAYLARTIYSNWANWCRTYLRKWSQDTPMSYREDSDHDDSNWEHRIPDPARQENVARVNEAFRRLSTTLYKSMEGVPACKPIQAYELQMYDLLERGVPLTETVKRMKVPDSVRRAILQSVSEMGTRAA